MCLRSFKTSYFAVIVCMCVCAWICISTFIYGGVRHSVAYFYLLFVEVIYCFCPESWKAGCLLRRQRDEGARQDANPEHRLAESETWRGRKGRGGEDTGRIFVCPVFCANQYLCNNTGSSDRRQ